MKGKMYLFAAAVTMIMASCGSSKQQQQNPYGYPPYGYPPQQGYYQQPGYYPQQPQLTNQQQRQMLDPLTMESNISQTEMLANQGWAAGKLRGYGSAESGNRDMARNRAAVSARAQIAATMRSLVQSYMTDYNEDLAEDEAFSNTQMFAAIQEQIVKETVEGVGIIFSDVQRIGTNRYFYEVCVEMDKGTVEQAMLSSCAKAGIRMEQEKFREKAQNVWDRMSVERAGENPAMADFQNKQQQQQMNIQQQQHDMNMEQQYMDMQQNQQQHNQNMQQQQMQMNQQQQLHNQNMQINQQMHNNNMQQQHYNYHHHY